MCHSIMEIEHRMFPHHPRQWQSCRKFGGETSRLSRCRDRRSKRLKPELRPIKSQWMGRAGRFHASRTGRQIIRHSANGGRVRWRSRSERSSRTQAAVKVEGQA